MRLYLDACCLSRLTDDQSQARVRAEAMTVERILQLIHKGSATWVSSAVLELEIGRNPNEEKRLDAAALAAHATETIVPSAVEAARAEALQQLGFSTFDALHIACAEKGAADVFLTTDDDLLRRAQQHSQFLRIRVENPLSWYQETMP